MTHLDFTNFLENWLSYILKCLFQQNNLINALIWRIFTFSSDTVYDGHGGAKIASHVSKHLHKTLVRRPEYKQGNYEEAFVKVGFLFNLLKDN